MSETVILGGASTHPGGTLALGGGTEKPMLGRYQWKRSSARARWRGVPGQGPKIGRVVAIKTMALSQEFEADELAEVKERFFAKPRRRGASAIPTSSPSSTRARSTTVLHRHGAAEGQGPDPYTKTGATLPLDKVASIVARVADALGYAHKNNVVHRDVKPANVMYELESDVVKVTTSASPASPIRPRPRPHGAGDAVVYVARAAAGQKIDGRSDLFSLAVSLYQLSCGRLPFEGDSMAQLMYKIATSTPPTS